MDVLEHRSVRGLAARRPGARLADADHEHLGARRLEMMLLLEVALEVCDEVLLDVQHTAAELAHRVVVVGSGELVMRRALAEVGGVKRS